jgi:hypothetical protein
MDTTEVETAEAHVGVEVVEYFSHSVINERFTMISTIIESEQGS